MIRSRFRGGVLAALALLACVSCTASADYVAADAETYRILSPFTLSGIDSSTLPADEKNDLRALVASWETRIRLASPAAKEPAK